VSEASIRHFYDLADLEADQVLDLLLLARRLQTHPEPRALEGKVLSLLFLSPSLRTLSSFQAAMIRMGGGAFVISPEMSIHGMEVAAGVVMDGKAAEHLADAVPVIASYGDALGVRVFAERRNLQRDLADTTYREVARHAGKPLINLESAVSHPCQSLADWKTLDELGVAQHGGKIVISWAFHPKALPLSGPISAVNMAALRGMDVTVLRPDGFELPASVAERARQIAAKTGGSVRETSDRREALQGAQVVYVKEWSSTRHYGDSVAEKKLRDQHADWCVEESWFRETAPDCRLMHAMPVRRGVAVQDAVLDGPRSALTHQAENRMWSQMAVLYRMMRP
jgi:N-acetylornithine carbamoyltransferase